MDTESSNIDEAVRFLAGEIEGRYSADWAIRRVAGVGRQSEGGRPRFDYESAAQTSSALPVHPNCVEWPALES